jgi:hypothetical protein
MVQHLKNLPFKKYFTIFLIVPSPMLSTRRALKWTNNVIRYPATIKVAWLGTDFFSIYVAIDPSRVERYAATKHLEIGGRVAITPSDRHPFRIGGKSPVLCKALPFTYRTVRHLHELLPIDIFLGYVKSRRARGFQDSTGLFGACQDASAETD